MEDEIDSQIPNTSSAWQLWHHDMFDRDSSPSLQASGTNLVQGLYELWLCTLHEGILENGSASFSRFHLTWGETASARVDVFVKPFNNLSLLKLRHWAHLAPQDQNGEEEQRKAVLLRLAQLHYDLLRNSSRWRGSSIDWSAESKELLAGVQLKKGPEEL